LKVSPSRIKTYQTCPKRYHYYYVQGLVAKHGKRKHFDKGNYFHELAHVYYRLIKDLGVKPGSDHVLAMVQKRMEEDLESHLTTGNLDVFKEITGKVIRFIKEQSPIIDEGIEVLAVEEELNVPIELPSSRIISMFGFLDLRYRQGDYRGIRDHKTGEKAWTGQQVGFSNQLLFYNAGIYALTGEVYRPEINFVNTHEKELQIYLEQICILIDEMLDCKPTPHYDERVCGGCPYKLPCMMERKGIDPSPILKAHYVPRDETPRERSFTNENTDSNETD
jgi:hypothetical protein